MKTDRFTDRATRSINLAIDEATQIGNQFLEPQHILLGLLKEGQGMACRLLKDLDVDTKQLSKEINERFVTNIEEPYLNGVTYSLTSTLILDEAWSFAQGRGCNYIGTEHLLIALYHVLTADIYDVLQKYCSKEDLIKHLDMLCPPTPEAQQIYDLCRLKEQAVCDQDFELAAKYRDEADSLLRKQQTNRQLIINLIEGPECEWVKDDQSVSNSTDKEIVSEITYALMMHYRNRSQPSEVLAEIKELLK